MSTPKRYKLITKLAAIVLFVLALIMLIATIGIVYEINDYLEYYNYYQWEIIGDAVEVQEDGKYLITLEIKNTGAYQADIHNNTFQIEYGNGNMLENLMTPYPDGYLYDTLNYALLPAGQTIKHQILIAPPNGTSSVRISYNGESYNIIDALDKEWEYSFYTVKLK